MPAGAFAPDGGGWDQEVSHLEDVINAAAHPQHNNGFKIVQVRQAVYNEGGLGGTDAKIDHRAINIGGVDNAKVALGIFTFCFFPKSLDILFEICNQHMITEIFQFTIGVSLQGLADVLVFFERHSGLLYGYLRLNRFSRARYFF